MFSILQKPQETVNAEDLEKLQNQIERNLVNVVTQRWELEKELLALDTTPDSSQQNFATNNQTLPSLLANNEDSVSSESSTIILPNLPSKKRAHKNDRPPKRFKHNNPPHHSKQPKFEAPEKLWPFFEQFCAAPTEEQVRELDDMIKAIDKDKDYYKVPALGKKDTSVTEVSLGALTQRLVSSLIEEGEDRTNDGKPASAKKKNFKPNKSVDLNSAKNLEKRIRQELEKCSILTQKDDIPYTSEEDEVLRELLACQYELQTIQNQNKLYMEVLLKKAKRHLELEAERAKLKESSADVLAAYQRLIQAKQRKRNPTKKEKEAAYRALKLHSAIYEKCDDIYMSSLDRRDNFSQLP